MAWLFVPSTQSASAPEGEDWTLPSSWQCQLLARSAWWRGKPSPSRTWSKRCGRVSWLPALCGAMSPASTAAHGVALWISSLAASRASRTVRLESASGGKTSGTSGRTPGASSCSPAPPSASSKTSRACSRPAAPNASCVTWSALVASWRADYSARQKSASRIAATASSSWPTIRAADGCQAPLPPSGKPERGRLEQSVANWPTPTARDHKGSGEATTRADGKLRNDMLDWAAERFWRTPTDDSRRGGPADPASRKQQGHTVNLQDQATYWSTPRVAVGEYTRDRGQKGSDRPTLEGEAKLWSTPRACSGERSSGGNRTEMVSQYLPPDPATPMDGDTSSKPGRSLNPLFVEWLMGWPIGWTGCACAETEFTRWRSATASALASLELSPGSQPQASLF